MSSREFSQILYIYIFHFLANRIDKKILNLCCTQADSVEKTFTLSKFNNNNNNNRCLLLCSFVCRTAKNRRYLRQFYSATTAVARSQQPSVRLRFDHSRHTDVRLASRERDGEIPGQTGREHRTRSRICIDQRQRTVQGE